MIRVLRVKATNQWCGPAIIDGSFPDDGSAWADAVAVTLGLETGALEVVDGETDPRDGELLSEPPPPIPPYRPTTFDIQKVMLHARLRALEEA